MHSIKVSQLLTEHAELHEAEAPPEDILYNRLRKGQLLITHALLGHYHAELH